MYETIRTTYCTGHDNARSIVELPILACGIVRGFLKYSKDMKINILVKLSTHNVCETMPKEKRKKKK